LAPLWGLLADNIGVRETLVVVGLAAAAVTTLIGLSWIRIRHLPPPEHSALAIVRREQGSPTPNPVASAESIPTPAPPLATTAEAAARRHPELSPPPPAPRLQPETSSIENDRPLWRKANILTALAIGTVLGLAAAVGQRNGNGHPGSSRPTAQSSDPLDALHQQTDTARERLADWIDPPVA
jgi:hypothetical protein